MYGIDGPLILANDRVSLTEDLPELALRQGQSGVVRTAWLFPNVAYEVEFSDLGGTGCGRVLLLHRQVLPAARHGR